jgi:putative ABC transport system substrate-binding protein
MPVIGFLGSPSPEGSEGRLAALRQGLADAGYVDGRNLTIEFRWAENRYDRMPMLVADLIQRKAAVIIAYGAINAALSAKAATTVTPIVFLNGSDPVKFGLVASLNRPGGNLTGINFFNTELTAKRLELLREVVPGAARVAVLVNPTIAANTESVVRDVGAAARAVGLQIQVLNAGTSREIEAVFAAFVRERPDALLVSGDAFFASRRVQLALLAARHALPGSYASRQFAEAGGLMSYGSNIADAYRQLGVYTGRILKGAKPADLPVVQASKIEFVINALTARVLGLTVPDKLLVAADEVIE